MTQRFRHYFSPKLEAQICAAKGNFGVFARAPIAAGELLIVWGGVIITGEQFDRLTPKQQEHTVQIEENLYQVSLYPAPGDYINHSCSPNAGLRGEVMVAAMCAIVPGEEVCFDYAMSDGSPYDEFDCACGTQHCRGRVTGEDWRRPELQARYAGYFSPYLQRRIERLRREQEVFDIPGQPLYNSA